MADYILDNGIIKISVNTHGAELRSLVALKSGREYMWCGDGKYWNRVSPVLFPFVGKLNNQTYRYNGAEYSGVPQHGYARDCEFELSDKSDSEIWFELKADEFWQDKYPFDFTLRIGYKLEGKKIYVMWQVTNNGMVDMPFSIGAHPAFWCGVTYDKFTGEDKDLKVGCMVDYHTKASELVSGIINDRGVLGNETKTISLNDGKMVIDEHTFDEDALIIESSDIKKVSLVTGEGERFIIVSFDAPMLGVWSPVGKKAPFVCIEPWYGRCDRADFTGSLEEREYGNIIKPSEVFDKQYVIEII